MTTKHMDRTEGGSDAPRGEREFTIIVTGTAHKWREPRITHTQVVTLFDPAFPQHPEITYSVTYEHGPRQNPEGILAPGESVAVDERMVFRVSPTGKS